MHHVMKIDANWKPHNTPELIKLLSDMVKLLMLDLQRSIYGLGNFHLIGQFRKFAIGEDIFNRNPKKIKRNIHEVSQVFKNTTNNNYLI